MVTLVMLVPDPDGLTAAEWTELARRASDPRAAETFRAAAALAAPGGAWSIDWDGQMTEPVAKRVSRVAKIAASVPHYETVRKHPGHTPQSVHAGTNHGARLATVSSMAALQPEARARIMQAVADYGPDFPQSVEAMADQTLAVFAKATPDQIARGKAWYADGHDALHAMAEEYSTPERPISTEQACAVMAVCSPQTMWSKNIEQAHAIMKVHGENKPFEIDQATYDAMDVKPPRGPGTYTPDELSGSQLAFAHPEVAAAKNKGFTVRAERAFEILRGTKTIDEGVTGVKVRNFYNNLSDPTDTESVTIDAHQVRVQVPRTAVINIERKDWKGNPQPNTPWANTDTQTYFTGFQDLKHGLPPRVGTYPYFADAARLAARRVGLRPNELQAITWLVQNEGGNK